MRHILHCTNQLTCSNHPLMCDECWVVGCGNVSYYNPMKNNHENEKEEPVGNNQKFKIFLGTHINQADVKLNEWLEGNPNVTIINYQYQQARMGDHSICIMYEEN